jgi:hypothetical protein
MVFSGYVCSYVGNAPTHQTCITTVTSTTFQAAFCDNASSSSAAITIPATTLGNLSHPSTLSTISIYAPLIQLVFQSSDVQAMSTPSINLVSVSRTSNERFSKGTIAGIIVGGIASLGLVIVVIFLILNTRKRSQQSNRDGDGSWEKPELPGEIVKRDDLVELPGTDNPVELPGTDTLVELHGKDNPVELHGKDNLVELQGSGLLTKE